MKVSDIFYIAVLAMGISSAQVQDIQIEELSGLSDIIGNVRGNYTRQDGLYFMIITDYNTNGEDLRCLILKDTTIVDNLQATPQAAGSSTAISCNWAQPRSQP